MFSQNEQRGERVVKGNHKRIGIPISVWVDQPLLMIKVYLKGKHYM